jgi:hypothetical protein
MESVDLTGDVEDVSQLVYQRRKAKKGETIDLTNEGDWYLFSLVIFEFGICTISNSVEDMNIGVGWTHRVKRRFICKEHLGTLESWMIMASPHMRQRNLEGPFPITESETGHYRTRIAILLHHFLESAIQLPFIVQNNAMALMNITEIMMAWVWISRVIMRCVKRSQVRGG